MAELRPVAPAHRAYRDAVGVAELAARQHGVVSRAQLIDCGVSGSAIARWVATSRLHRVHPRVYAVGHSALSLDGRLVAALLYAGPQALLSHTTAGWVWSLIDAAPKRIHVTVPGRRRSLPAVRLHHSRHAETAHHRDLPVTTVARTLLDLAAVLPAGQLRRALAEADYRRLLEPPELKSVLCRGRRGSAGLRRAFDAHHPRLAATLSVLEERFLELCEDAGLPPPEVNAKVAGLMVDALWRPPRLIVELDGHAAHGSRAAIERDRHREIALRAAGYLVLRYTWSQITERSEVVIGDLRTALVRRRTHPPETEFEAPRARTPASRRRARPAGRAE
jgi:predicted transcriptional regulator of viral defense system